MPEVLDTATPERIGFLHIDLNSPRAEIAVLERLFDRALPAGVIVFDDYGRKMFHKQKKAEDDLMHRRGYEILEMPTGQGLVVTALRSFCCDRFAAVLVARATPHFRRTRRISRTYAWCHRVSRPWLFATPRPHNAKETLLFSGTTDRPILPIPASSSACRCWAAKIFAEY